MIGQTIGHYRILDKLGEGGMGVVYLAEDTTLDRKVALKVLPQELSQSQERLERFQREAKTLAALDHPNIVTIHSVEEADGVRFLTMQLVEGRRLAELIPKGGMPLERIFEIAIPLADALATAHEKGVIHRDLKPANIMVTNEGRVKVLDFGLAKLRPDADATVETELPTEALTAEGRIVGTMPYMSPEQIEGRLIDARSDIFSLGAVLYEMASGVRPFGGDSSASMMARIIAAEPEPLGEIRPDLPPDLLRIVRRCLRKKPEERYNDTRDLLVALKDLREDSSSHSSSRTSRLRLSSGTRPHRLRYYRVGLALAALILVVSLLGWVLSRANRTTPTPVVARHQQVTFTGDAESPAISPDAVFLAYATSKGVEVRDLQSGGTTEVLSFGAPPQPPPRLVWSPDGLNLHIWGHIDGDMICVVVPRLGGAKRPAPCAKCWSPDGRQMASTDLPQKSIRIVSTENPETVKEIAVQGDYRWLADPDWSQMLDALLVVTINDDDTSAIHTVSPDSSRQAVVFEGSAKIPSAKWSLSEPAIYFLQSTEQGSELWKVHIAERTLEAKGTARPIQTGLQAGPWLSVSREGPMLAYTRGVGYSTFWKVELDGDPDGPDPIKLESLSGSSPSGDFSVSPDGTKLAIARGEGNANIHLFSFEDESMKQVTFQEGRAFSPVWSPDGNRIAFASIDDEEPSLWVVWLEQGIPQALPVGDISSEAHLAWSPGAKLIYQKQGSDMFHLYDFETRSDEPLLSEYLRTMGWYFGPMTSPDGSRVALASNLGGSALLTVDTRDRDREPTILAREGNRWYGDFFQELDADKHRGREAKLQARAKYRGEGGRASVFLYAVLPGGQSGIHPYLVDRATTSADWTDIEFTKNIDDSAVSIRFGGFLIGAGTMWADGFELSVQSDKGDWESVRVRNPGFEEIDNTGHPTSWEVHSSNLAAYSYTSEEAFEGQNSITGRQLSEPAEGTFWPVGWSPDGQSVYAITGDASIIYQIPADGGAIQPYLDLAVDDEIIGVSISADGKTVVYETVSYNRDVWVTSGFDPDLN